MTVTADAPTASDRATPHRLPLGVSQAAVALLLAAKLYITIATPVTGDEAYYWMWGQKLGWSYFDHPPLDAWLLRLVSVVFGWNVLSLRLLTWVTLAGTFAIFWAWARRLQPSDPQTWFWRAAAIYLASPVFFIALGLAVHDHLLMFLCLAATHCLLIFTEKWESKGGGFGWLYAAGLLIGLAVLTKYNGVLVGVGFPIFLLAWKPARSVWRSPHLYLAGLLSVALQAPVFWWNATEGFASYNFHLAERWGRPLFEFNPIFLAEFIAYAVLFTGPFLVPAIVGMMRRPLRLLFSDRARILALSIFAAAMVGLGFLSLFVQVYFYWNVVAFFALMPLLVGWLRPWQLVGHLVFGIAIAGLIVYHVTGIPIGFEWTIASSYGWPAVAARVQELEKDHPVGFVATPFYTTAAQLGFALQDPEVTALSDRHDQYDYWFDAGTHNGQDAIVVSDQRFGTTFAPLFETVTRLDDLAVERYGTVVYRPAIYLGHKFRGTPTAPATGP